MSIMNANEMAVAVYSLRIRAAAATRKLADLTEQVTAEQGAAAGAMAVNMYNLPKSMQKALNSASNRVRGLFIRAGIQIGDGTYAVPLARVAEFDQQLGEAVREYNATVAGISDAARDGSLEQAMREEQGAAFDPSRVPSPESIAARYGVDHRLSVNFDAPAVQRSVAVLGAEVRASIEARARASAEAENREKLAAAVQYVRDGVRDLLTSLVKFDAPDTKGLHAKSIDDKLARVLNDLPAYNVAEDSEVAALIEQVRTTFIGVDGKAVKERTEAGKAAVEKAKEMVQTLF